jgi:hypothetical protein
VQAIDRQPQRAPDGAPVHYECHRPEQTTLYCLVQQHAASFIAHTNASTGAKLPRFIKEEFDTFQECGILAHGFLRLRCGEPSHHKLLGFSCKRRGFCPSCGARRMLQTAAHLIDHGMVLVPVGQWVLSLPIPLRLRMAAQPELIRPVPQVAALRAFEIPLRRRRPNLGVRRRVVIESPPSSHPQGRVAPRPAIQAAGSWLRTASKPIVVNEGSSPNPPNHRSMKPLCPSADLHRGAERCKN